MGRLRASAGSLLLLICWAGVRALPAAGQQPGSAPKPAASAAEIESREICPAGRALKPEQIAQCYSCHGDVQAAFAEASRHPVGEGRMTCGDCHDAHDSASGGSVKAAADANATCTRCHTEKAGPFTWEHPVVKVEGCVSCHSPHGSPNAHLLTFSDANTLCLQCHSATNASVSAHTAAPAAAGQKQAAAAQCTSCHTQIHGSNASDIFFQ